MKQLSRAKKPKPRLPVEAVLKLKSYPITTKKGKKGYDRHMQKKETEEMLKDKD